MTPVNEADFATSDNSIAVGIPSYNRGEILCRTLSQILPRLGPVVREVIVADQCPSHPPEVRRRLWELMDNPRLRYLTPERPGLPIARNAILANANTEFLVFLDDDVILPDGFFETYLRTFRETGAQIIQGQVVQLGNLDEFDQPAELLRQRGCPQFDAVSRWMVDLRFFIGANHAVRRSRALQVGGYDERMGTGCAKNEEADFINRAVRSPHEVYYAADCWLVHYSAPTGGVRQRPCDLRGEWKKSYTDLLWCFRHGCRLGDPGALFWKAVRRGPLRKENIFRFWRQPWAWMSFALAAFRAFRFRHDILGIAPDGSRRHFPYSPPAISVRPPTPFLP